MLSVYPYVKFFPHHLTQLISILISTIFKTNAKTYSNWFRQKGPLIKRILGKPHVTTGWTRWTGLRYNGCEIWAAHSLFVFLSKEPASCFPVLGWLLTGWGTQLPTNCKLNLSLFYHHRKSTYLFCIQPSLGRSLTGAFWVICSPQAQSTVTTEGGRVLMHW